MTPDVLRRLIAAGDRGALCAALAGLDEAQQAGLADAALDIYRQVDGAWSAIVFEKEDRVALVAMADPKFIAALQAANYSDWRIPRLAAGLAVLALCDRRVVENPLDSGLGWFWGDLRDMPQRVLEVLKARRPKWLADWIKKQAKQEAPLVTWFVERGLIRAGVLPPNTSEDYIRRMADDHSAIHAGSFEVESDNLPVVFEDRQKLLLADPELLAGDVWRLFEVETNALVYHSGWDETLLALSASGHLDRQRLLLASARAMGLPFRPAVVGGYGKFHEALDPTIDERAALADEYLALLGNNQPLAVGTALGALELLAKAKRLEAEKYFAACADVFRIPKKTQPAKALKLARLLLKQQPECSPAAAAAASGGVGHESPDVQLQAIELLETLQIPVETRRDLERWHELVAAANRPRLQALTAGPKQHESSQPRSGIRGASGMPASLRALEARAAAIPTSLRELAGVDAALRTIAARTEPEPVAVDGRRIPRRDPSQRIEPIGSLDELIDTVARVIEKVDDVLDLERILDGVSRFIATNPSDFEKRVAPLRKRIEKLSEPHSWTMLDVAKEVGLAQLIRFWLELPQLQPVWGLDYGGWSDMQGWFLRYRARELLWRNERERKPLPLLALPTHKGGWIDPVVLVERIQVAYEAPRELMGNCDLAQALLRLTPDGRQEALELLGPPSYYNGGATLRYALGADVELKSFGGLCDEELQLAAVRARAAIVGAANLAPPLLCQVALAGDGRLSVDGPVTEDPALPSDLLMYVFSHRHGATPRIALGGKRQWLTDWETLTCPIDPRPGCLMGRLTHLFDHEMSWGEEAARLAAAGTSLDDDYDRTLVTDAFIQAIAESRLDPVLVGRQLARQAAELKLNRSAAVLSAVAKPSPLHQWAVFRILETLVGQLPSLPRDLHVLLTPLLECALVLGRQVNDEAQKVLQQIKGVSKSKQLAQRLLSLTGDQRPMETVRVQACEACLTRAERWQSLSQTKAPAARTSNRRARATSR